MPVASIHSKSWCSSKLFSAIGVCFLGADTFIIRCYQTADLSYHRDLHSLYSVLIVLCGFAAVISCLAGWSVVLLLMLSPSAVWFVPDCARLVFTRVSLFWVEERPRILCSYSNLFLHTKPRRFETWELRCKRRKITDYMYSWVANTTIWKTLILNNKFCFEPFGVLSIFINTLYPIWLNCFYTDVPLV